MAAPDCCVKPITEEAVPARSGNGVNAPAGTNVTRLNMRGGSSDLWVESTVFALKSWGAEGLVADPGVLIKGRVLEFCRTWPNQTEVSVKGRHFLQEDSPDEIGRALQEFVKSVRGSG